ncbi:hypothetical protein BP00DRAFT_7795 [Aspergillus indologenus CBS 114.80]|uniref:Uncharacterized protein n=1 Tax=Aspergillus indologenus CBS 114.80 TaxID=1450541 RepID=A0A2V5J405_9EURO|nr:hypothetical protein BP00DRAFT_7795 [Aspergillus indologenus CBS 114.80]
MRREWRTFFPVMSERQGRGEGRGAMMDSFEVLAQRRRQPVTAIDNTAPLVVRACLIHPHPAHEGHKDHGKLATIFDRIGSWLRGVVLFGIDQ